jgi:hypothetical protein
LKDLLLSVEFWQNLRFALIYPVLAVSGTAWAIGFFLHYHFSGAPGDRWAGRAGIGVIAFAVCGMIGLIIAQRDGYSIVTTVIFSLGTIILCGVMVWGAIWLLHHYLSVREHDQSTTTD